jgi:integrase/recombinase XerD
MSTPNGSARSTTALIPAPEVEAFLALLAARRAPRTVEAYRRDLADLAAYLGKSPAEASVDDIRGWLADLRARGLAPASIARRAAAARSFFRHLVLVGSRADNPAADVDLPRRRDRRPRALSPGEVERLIEAAQGPTPRALRDRALVEILYGAGLRVSEAVGLDRGRVDLENRIVRCLGTRSESCRLGGRRPKLCVVTSPAGARTSTAATAPNSSSTPKEVHSRGRASSSSFAASRAKPASSRRASTRISYGTRSPHTCSRAERTSEACRRCSATPTLAPPSSTRTCRTSADAIRTSARIRMPAGAGAELGRASASRSSS